MSPLILLLYIFEFYQLGQLNIQYMESDIHNIIYIFLIQNRGRRGCDRMTVGFSTTCAISAYQN